MGLRIQHNIAAMNAHKNLTISDNMMSNNFSRPVASLDDST